MENGQAEAQPWPLRAAILAALGTAGGLAIHALLDGVSGQPYASSRYALATFTGIGLLAFGHGWVRGRLLRAVLTGAVAGLIVALVFLWNGTPTDDWSGGESWRIVAALLAMFIFIPMAQAGGEESGFRAPPHWSPPGLAVWAREHFDYATVHDHGWTNLIIAGLSVLFAGLFFLMLLLVGALFDLVHVSFLKEWLEKDAVIAALWGGAIGGSTGLLRDHRRIISALQTVAMTVLRMAAPVLAVALALFLLILPLTGLAPLWDATRSTTPILLCAVVIALVLANSVIGDGRDSGSRAFVLRGAAFVLAHVTAPLAVIAAISTGLRVGQYGWTPERLWAATFVLMACVVALSYVVAVIVARGRWAEGLRSANLRLAFLIWAVALLLSTPLVRFDAVATRDQMARLADGRTPPDMFDYRAMWWDFGQAGREAIRELASRGRSQKIRDAATVVQHPAQYGAPIDKVEQAWLQGEGLDRRMTVLPRKVHVPESLREQLVERSQCGNESRCTLYYEPGNDWAIAIREGVSPNARLIQGFSGVVIMDRALFTGFDKDALAAVRQGKVEVRTESIHRIYLDGKPFGEPLRAESATTP